MTLPVIYCAVNGKRRGKTKKNKPLLSVYAKQYKTSNNAR